MCGIAGWIAFDGARLDPTLLDRMLDRIAHRGPDGTGRADLTSRDGQTQVTLGHRRLAIIDPDGGHQPLWSADRARVVVQNGEIYNFQEIAAQAHQAGHPFATRSDTEAILALWPNAGTALPERLRGMFAFALWDTGSETLLLARDRFGKKPLFLAELALPGGGRALAFASEIKALTLLPGVDLRPDPVALWQYLSFRYVPGPRTLYQGVRKLMPGHWRQWRKGEWQEGRFWQSPDLAPDPQGGSITDEAEAVAGFRAAFDQAVALRLMSDVPFGAFLSGGIDSAAVVATMRRHLSQPVRSFSVGFADSRLSEADAAAATARALGCDHHAVTIAAEDLIDLLPEASWFRDAPVSEASDLPLLALSRQAVGPGGVKMVLTGEGADELLGGYPKYKGEALAARWHRLVPPWLGTPLLRPLIAALPFDHGRLRLLLEALTLPDPRDRWPRWFGALSWADRRQLAPILAAQVGADDAGLAETGLFPAGAHLDGFRRMAAFDHASWLPDNLAERGDRMLMAAGLEGRMPFLDQDLAAFAARLPDRLRVGGPGGKRILRLAMRGIVPDAVLDRPKLGFKVPIADWFRTRLAGWVEDLLLSSDSRCTTWLDRAMLAQILAQHREGRINHEKLIWTLITLETFLRRPD